jgi:hypothetical protein
MSAGAAPLQHLATGRDAHPDSPGAPALASLRDGTIDRATPAADHHDLIRHAV